MSDIEHEGTFCETTAQELFDRIKATASRFVGVAAAVNPQSRIPGMEWDARTLTAHVLTVIWRYTRRDPESPAGLAATYEDVSPLNDSEAKAVVADLSHEDVLSTLHVEVAQLERLYDPATVDLTRRYPFHLGATIDAAGAGGNLIGELLIHGRDLAEVDGLTWPIADRDALLMLNGWLQILPSFIDRERARRMPVHTELRIAGGRTWAVIAAAVPASRPARDEDVADAVIKTPAATMALLSTRRVSALGAVRGGVRLVGGRRPWRLPRMTRVALMP